MQWHEVVKKISYASTDEFLNTWDNGDLLASRLHRSRESRRYLVSHSWTSAIVSGPCV